MTKYAASSSPHVHEPNLTPPNSDPALELMIPSGKRTRIQPADLANMPQEEVHDCYIVSTGHGTSGPFTFSGVAVRDFLDATMGSGAGWSSVELLGADGFGAFVGRDELEDGADRPALLATHLSGELLTRDQGLVRLIVPSETGDALRQVKWLSKIIVHA